MIGNIKPDLEKGAFVDNSIDSSVLFIAFGSLTGVYEFLKVSKGIPAKKLFLRDFYKSWYQRGTLGIAQNISELGDYLREVIVREKPERTIMIGNSAGGFATLLFATILNVDYALAFAPQTFIDPLNKLRYLDARYYRELPKVYLHAIAKGRFSYYDVKPQLLSHNSKTNIHIYYNQNHHLDTLHAKRCEGIQNITLHSFSLEPSNHMVGTMLNKNGELLPILMQAVKGEL